MDCKRRHRRAAAAIAAVASVRLGEAWCVVVFGDHSNAQPKWNARFLARRRRRRLCRSRRRGGRLATFGEEKNAIVERLLVAVVSIREPAIAQIGRCKRVVEAERPTLARVCRLNDESAERRRERNRKREICAVRRLKPKRVARDALRLAFGDDERSIYEV